jgi:hypothetical protein
VLVGDSPASGLHLFLLRMPHQSPATQEYLRASSTQKVRELVEMGFPVELAQSALQQCHGDVQAAVHALLAGASKDSPPVLSRQSSTSSRRQRLRSDDPALTCAVCFTVLEIASLIHLSY